LNEEWYSHDRKGKFFLLSELYYVGVVWDYRFDTDYLGNSDTRHDSYFSKLLGIVKSPALFKMSDIVGTVLSQ